ncbi:MAG TPA: squalene cyclase, partial [Terrimesophilobacter sp.]|nr:squalene cyclase [Terrimesophilobacter sp.]
ELPYWGGEVDACINAYTLANGVWLGRDVSGLAHWFVDHQMAEGGWDCEWVNGSTRSSFHSTLNSLKGILEYEVATGGTPQLREARHAAEEYLLSRRLLYRASTGELVGWWVDRFAYPFRWFYSALNAVNYFRDASLHDGSELDERITDAVELIREARTGDGRWLQGRRHPGRVWFEVDVDAGEPSQWLTFYAMRVLDWWDST